MALIVLCGFPLSGKSAVANKLSEYFRKWGPTIVISEGDSLSTTSRDVYSDPAAEKQLHSSFLSQVAKSLPVGLVIADGLNYTKGLRYQLSLMAREAKMPFCLVHVSVSEDVCYQRNEVSQKYSIDVLEALFFQFETPSPLSRWDTPCFVSAGPEDLPLSEIEAVVMSPALSLEKNISRSQEIHQYVDSIVSEVNAALRTGTSRELLIRGKPLPVPRPVTAFETRRLKADLAALLGKRAVSEAELEGLLFEALQTLGP